MNIKKVVIYCETKQWNTDYSSYTLVTDDIDVIQCDCSITTLCGRGMALSEKYNDLHGNSDRRYLCEIVE